MSKDEKVTKPSVAEAADNLETMTDAELTQFLQESRIVIRPGGEVVIENLTPDLLVIADELDPDNPGVQCRLELSKNAKPDNNTE